MDERRVTALASSLSSSRLVAMRVGTVSRRAVSVFVIVTSWAVSASTWAMPWPMRPVPMTAMRAFVDLPSSAAASRRRRKARAGVKIGCLRSEEQERTGEVRWLAETPRHAREEARAHRLAAFDCRRTSTGSAANEIRRAERIDGDAGLAEFAAECLGDAVDRRLRGAIGGISGGMAEQTARRRQQDDLAAAAVA